MTMGNRQKPQKSRLKIDVPNLNGAYRTLNVLRNLQADAGQFSSSHDGGGAAFALDESLTSSGIHWRPLPFCVVADDASPGAVTESGAYRNVLVRGGYVRHDDGVRQADLPIAYWLADPAKGDADYDMEAVDLHPSLAPPGEGEEEDEQKLFGIDPDKQQELASQRWYRLRVDRGATQWLWLETGTATGAEGDAGRTWTKTTCVNPNALRLCHGALRPVVRRSAEDPDWRADEADRSGSDDRTNTIVVLAMVKNVGNNIYVYQERVGNVRLSIPLPQAKQAFGTKAWLEGEQHKVKVYPGKVAWGDHETDVGETTLDVSGSVVNTFVAINRLNGVPEIGWSAASPSTTMDVVRVWLHEFSLSDGQLVVSRVRSGGRDVLFDTPLR